MNLWLAFGISTATVIVVALVRALVMRAARRRRARVVEQPNSHYTPKLVLDRDMRHRWHNIALDRMHEINRAEVIRLLEKVEAVGVDGMTVREREFLDRMAELNPQRTPKPSPARPVEDPFWPDPFAQPRLGTRDANH